MTKISVIVPVYNSGRYLREALDSALNQTYQDVEVVCVNDGSVDESSAILAEYKRRDKRVKVITQSNKGGSSARNNGIKHASGEYIMFLDADDMYAPGIVSSAYNRAIERGVDIVYYNFARFIGKPTKMAVVNRDVPRAALNLFTKDTYATGFFNDFAIITWNKLIKRSVIVDHGLRFNEGLSHNHDVDFSIRLMLAANSYSWLDEVGYYYRSNDNGITATKRSDPTNALRILADLNTIITTDYKKLKPSFDRYVIDMLIGTVIKYSGDADKLCEVFAFSHDAILPILMPNVSESASKSIKIFYLIKNNDFPALISYLNSPGRKLRVNMRRLYDVAQGVFAQFAV